MQSEDNDQSCHYRSKSDRFKLAPDLEIDQIDRIFARLIATGVFDKTKVDSMEEYAE